MSLLPSLVSPADAAFLLPETRDQPMHVGSLQLFTPPPDRDVHDLAEVYQQAIATTELAPLFRKRLTRGVGTLGQWAWEEDEVDLEHHVRHSSLPKPGRMRELLALTSRLHGTLLDRQRPLWEMHLIEGLEDGRFAVYTKIHHALLDGVSGLRLLERSLLYSALAAVLSAGFLFGVLTLMAGTGQPFLTEYRLGALFLLVLAALAFEPVRQQLQEWLGRRLLKGRAAASELAEAMNGDDCAQESSTACTREINGAPRELMPPPMTTRSTSRLRIRMRTATAVFSTSRSRTSTASGTPASAASNSCMTGYGCSLGHCRATAEPEASVSRQPRCPQLHSAPSASTGMCPTSPAVPREPRHRAPSITTPAASPVPRLR